MQHWNYEAAFKATEEVYGVKPDLTREGGSIPITLTFANTVCELSGLHHSHLAAQQERAPAAHGPLGRRRSLDEREGTFAIRRTSALTAQLDLSNYIKGTQLLGSYLYAVADASS